MRLKRRELEVVPPYVAMADITFNLVLFFIIMAKTQDDSHIIWEPAKDTAGTKLVVPNTKLSVSVDQDNKVYLNGVPIGIRELSGKLTQELGDKPQAERMVLLKVHRETLASTFNPIMEAVSEAGGEVVHVIDEEVQK